MTSPQWMYDTESLLIISKYNLLIIHCTEWKLHLRHVIKLLFFVPPRAQNSKNMNNKELQQMQWSGTRKWEKNVLLASWKKMTPLWDLRQK